jgi:hypothetical protein
MRSLRVEARALLGQNRSRRRLRLRSGGIGGNLGCRSFHGSTEVITKPLELECDQDRRTAMLYSIALSGLLRDHERGKLDEICRQAA